MPDTIQDLIRKFEAGNDITQDASGVQGTGEDGQDPAQFVPKAVVIAYETSPAGRQGDR